MNPWNDLLGQHPPAARAFCSSECSSQITLLFGVLSDFTTCLPVPSRGRGPLVRFKQAVFRVLDFGRIGVGTCLATAVESVRSIRASAGPSNSVIQGALEFAEIEHLFLVFWCAKKEPPDHFRSSVIWWRMGQMHHDLAQFVDHGRLFNLFFSSSKRMIGCRDMVISSFG